MGGDIAQPQGCDINQFAANAEPVGSTKRTAKRTSFLFIPAPYLQYWSTNFAAFSRNAKTLSEDESFPSNARTSWSL